MAAKSTHLIKTTTGISWWIVKSLISLLFIYTSHDLMGEWGEITTWHVCKMLSDLYKIFRDLSVYNIPDHKTASKWRFCELTFSILLCQCWHYNWDEYCKFVSCYAFNEHRILMSRKRETKSYNIRFAVTMSVDAPNYFKFTQ